MRCRSLRAFLLIGSVSVATPALAQTDSTIIAQVVPFDYDRDRNVSVAERARPDYDPLGIRAGGFLVFPRVETAAGYTDNVFLAETAARDDAYVSVAPSIRAQSDWSRHALSVSGGGQFRRFLDASVRNENGYYLRGSGRADIGSNVSLSSEADVGRVYETPFSANIDSSIAGVSSYRYNSLLIRGQYVAGRLRSTLALARNEFDFDASTLTNNLLFDQSDRDRVVLTAIGQAQYALSPSFATFAQLSYSNSDYDRTLLNGQPNRDSRAYRALAGVNVDLSALMRGSIGIGYMQRDYDSALYRSESGFSMDAQLEYFLSTFTTLTFRARRTVEDSSLASIGSYYDNRLSVRADHELLSNLILNATAEVSKQDFIRSDRANDVYRFGTGGQYLMSPSMQTRFNLVYAARDRNGTGFTGSLKEFRADVSLVIQR